MDSFPYPEAIIFDWDNTLVNSWPAITIALNMARSTYGLETWDVEEARIKSSRALRVSFPEWFGDEWGNARDIFYSTYHKEHANRLEKMDGAESLLKFVHEKGIPSLIVSTKRGDLLREEVKHVGWAYYFKAVFGATDLDVDKPHPMPVMRALEAAELHSANKNMWFLGDTHADVECALRAGCRPVLVNNLQEGIRLGVKWSFSDCNEVKKALYNYSA